MTDQRAGDSEARNIDTQSIPVAHHGEGRSLPIPRLLHKAEDALGVIALGVMTILPMTEILGRASIGQGVPGSVTLVQNLTLWVAFLGAMVAARDRRHLALATTSFLPSGFRGVASLFAAVVGTSIAAALAWASYEMVNVDRESLAKLAFGIPQWVAEVVMPVGFAVVAIRLWWHSGSIAVGEAHEGAPLETVLPAAQRWLRRLVVVAVVGVAAYVLPSVPEGSWAAWRWPLVVTVIGATVVGAPIFVALGGLAVVLFFGDAGFDGIRGIPSESYRVFAQPTLPTIPLFTLAGSLLAQGETPARLVRVFRALAGWLPGGTAVAAVLVCAFFTTFTGASGVTILALGALLLPVLVRDVYTERFALGTVTSAGSIGLLFPPSLPVILFGIAAFVPINELFVAGLAPGFVLVGLTALYSMWAGVRAGARLHRPDPREMVSAIWDAKWEVLLPVVVFAGLFGGFATTVEAAALTAVYAFVMKFVVQRDVSLRRDLARVFAESAVLVGGVLIILGCALGLTNYLTIAEIPTKGAAWVQAVIDSRITFLLVLNGFLVIVGMLMDIFSAIFVVVPLILPIAEVYKVDPLHLGVIFLVNLELGYLTPPVGLNLFLSSFRFRKPMAEVVRSIIPFMLVRLVAVLLVTYVPHLSVGIVNWLMR